jgi:hypothetical protein
MKKMKRNVCILPGAVAAACLVAGVHSSSVAAEVIPFSEAIVLLEENTTDGDLGFHLKADGEGWERVILMDSNYKRLLDVKVKGQLGKFIGLTELFSESAEPGFDEFPRDDFLSLFPEGVYQFFGRTLEGDWLVGSTELTHDIPEGPEVTSPEEDEEVDPNSDLSLEWNFNSDPNPPDSVIEFYEVVVEKDEDEERLRVFSVHMLATDTSVRVPSEFLEPGKDYKVEVIAQETSGNRASSEVEFSTTGDDD